MEMADTPGWPALSAAEPGEHDKAPGSIESRLISAFVGEDEPLLPARVAIARTGIIGFPVVSITTDNDLAHAASTYQTWGWPVTRHRYQVRLDVQSDIIGLIIPTLLATEVTAVLSAQRSAPPVLVHPCAPAYRLLVCSEPFPVELPWPPSIVRVTSPLLLPPTPTSRGPLVWDALPPPDGLRLCREIDTFGALRIALRDLVGPR